MHSSIDGFGVHLAYYTKQYIAQINMYWSAHMLPGAAGHLADRDLPFLCADLSRQMGKIIFYYSENISRQKERIYSGKLQPYSNVS